ncbi:Bgt-20919-3, partial [Blumeria graminis f. sp. tritici]
DPTVTRVTVVLDKPGDWFDWLFIRKDSCFRHDLWQYVNPETPRHSLPVLTEPPEPGLTSYKADAISLANLGKEDRDTCRWDYDRYERKLMEYRKLVQALADFNLEISKTISKKHIYLIQDCSTLY